MCIRDSWIVITLTLLEQIFYEFSAKRIYVVFLRAAARAAQSSANARRFFMACNERGRFSAPRHRRRSAMNRIESSASSVNRLCRAAGTALPCVTRYQSPSIARRRHHLRPADPSYRSVTHRVNKWGLLPSSKRDDFVPATPVCQRCVVYS